jgi:hypothetical protein
MPAYKVTLPLLQGWSIEGYVEAPNSEAAKNFAIRDLKQLYPQFADLKFQSDRIRTEEVR